MIHLDLKNIEELKALHYEAVESYVREIMSESRRSSFKNAVCALPGIDTENYTWLKQFILADWKILKIWTENEADKLQFAEMKSLYLNRFANGKNKFVDRGDSYNSMTLFKAMNVHVCPYCEDEKILVINQYEEERRTSEFDHFYPKSDYPGLAMCFYNLVPSGKVCNQLMKAYPIEANPYDNQIESLTWLYPDLPIGVNMDTVNVEQCAVKLHAKGGMVTNDQSLTLEQRYAQYAQEAYDLLRKRQLYTDEKLEEFERMGMVGKEQLKRDLFGRPREEAKGEELRTKMKKDLIDW